MIPPKLSKTSPKLFLLDNTNIIIREDTAVLGIISRLIAATDGTAGAVGITAGRDNGLQAVVLHQLLNLGQIALGVLKKISF